MEPVVVAAVAIAATSPLIGRAAGYVVAKSRWVEPGRAKTVMPEFPTADAPANGGAARRFDVSVARATRALGRRLRDRPDDVWAEGVAAELSIPRDVATAALERLRSNAPCSLRVTQDGKLVHRFDREGIERALAVTSGTGLVARSLLFVASIVANIGAVWPVVASGLFAGLALLALSSESDTSLLTAIGVLVALPFLFAGVIGGGAVVGALLTPLLPSPKLGNALPKEEEKKEKAGVAAKAAEHRADARSKRQSKRAEKRRRKAEEKRRARDEAGSAGAAAPPLRASGTHWQSLVTSTDAFGLTGIAAVVLAAIAIAGIPILLVVGAAALFGFSIGTFLLWVCIILLVVLFIAILIETGDIEAAGIMTPLVIIGLLLAVVLFALVGAIAWLVGLYSSIAEERPRATAPGGWVQRRGAGDVFTLVPTNDLVVRVQLALGRALARPKPLDPELASRLQSVARARGGRLSALEIMLLEAADHDTAISIGARTSSHAGGEIDVTKDGEIVFSYPEATQSAQSDPARECFTRDGAQFVAPIGIPVNIPGVTLEDIEGAERLCVGTGLVFGCALASHTGLIGRLFPGTPWTAPAFVVLGAALLFAGSFALAGVLRYAARAEARAGVFRDVRRATFAEVALLAETEARAVDARDVARRLHEATLELWPQLEREWILREVEVACDDLQLELDPDRMARDPASRPFALAPLRQRLASVRDTVRKPPNP